MRIHRLCAALAVAVTACAAASAQPAGLKSKDGFWTTADDKPLYIYRNIVAPICYSDIPCPETWAPLPATIQDAQTKDWTTALDDRGRWHWRYRGWPMFTRIAPWPDPATPSEPGWRPAVAIEGEVVDPAAFKDDPSRFAKPVSRGGTPPAYPPASRRAEETGIVGVVSCIDSQGRTAYPQISRSSGFPRLDDATLSWILIQRYEPARLDGKPVTTCNWAVELSWALEAG